MIRPRCGQAVESLGAKALDEGEQVVDVTLGQMKLRHRPVRGLKESAQALLGIDLGLTRNLGEGRRFHRGRSLTGLVSRHFVASHTLVGDEPLRFISVSSRIGRCRTERQAHRQGGSSGQDETLFRHEALTNIRDTKGVADCKLSDPASAVKSHRLAPLLGKGLAADGSDGRGVAAMGWLESPLLTAEGRGTMLMLASARHRRSQSVPCFQTTATGARPRLGKEDLMVNLRTLIVGAALAVVAPFANSHAAPQVLGLIATNAPVPLNCLGGNCTAEFSAFCLQRARELPERGTLYRAVGDSLTLIVTATDGSRRWLPGAGHLTITTARGIAAVRVAISQRTLKGLGAVSAAVQVGPRVSLVPIPVIGDPNPQSPMEIDAATGPLREVAEQLVDEGGPAVDAVRLIGRVVNALPQRGRADIETGQQLWRELVSESGETSAAIARAEESYARCQGLLSQGYEFSLRRCLEKRHDSLLLELNSRYWDAMGDS